MAFVINNGTLDWKCILNPRFLLKTGFFISGCSVKVTYVRQFWKSDIHISCFKNNMGKIIRIKKFQPARNDIIIHIVNKIKGLRLWFWLFKWRFTSNYVYKPFKRKYIDKEELLAKSTSADITLGLNKILIKGTVCVISSDPSFKDVLIHNGTTKSIVWSNVN